MARNKQQDNTVKTALVVTTSHRGVFFGYGTPSDAATIRLEKPRMVVYWSADVRSVVGLAATGPSNGCKVGPAASAITLRDVTSVIECTGEAAKKFEEIKW